MAGLFSKPKPAASTTNKPQAEGFQNRVSQFLTKRRSMRGRAAALLTTGNQRPQTAERQVTGN